MHGATAGRPVEHGLYSKRVPKGWEQDYEDFKADPEILSGHAEIALARTHLARHLASLKKKKDEETTAEEIAIGMDHLHKITRLQERESKRLSNERVVNEMIGRQVTQEMNVLRELLARYCDPAEAHRFLAEFVECCGATPEDEIESSSAPPTTHGVRAAPA